MSWEAFEPVATTVLYEGHVLYPYRASALKNRRRWNFGTLFPVGIAGEAAEFRLEALIECEAQPEVGFQLCSLHQDEPRLLEANGTGRHEFDGGGLLCRLEATLTEIEPGLWQLAATASNRTRGEFASRDEALPWTMQSAHLRCRLRRGAFVSAQDPGPERAAAAAACRCQGVYPVLMGEPGRRDLLLAAPIILEDYPKVAPQSPGVFCDAGEMDELLVLHLLTLSAAEKAEIRAAGGTAARILEQAGGSGGPEPEVLELLHGGVTWDPFASPPSEIALDGRTLRVGDRVRLHPAPGADLFNRLLEGKAARIQAIEQELEGAVHLAVVVEDDPGRDLGELRQTGHRFFFSVSEVEPM